MSRAKRGQAPKSIRPNAIPAGGSQLPPQCPAYEEFSDFFERALVEARAAVDEIYRNKYRIVDVREVTRGQR